MVHDPRKLYEILFLNNINEVLLESSHAPSFLYHLWLLPCDSDRGK